MTIFSMVTTESSNRYTPYALESFFRTTPFLPADRFILIDNDGALSLAPALRQLPFTLLVNERPRSFASNSNTALALARESGEAVVLLNNDVIFTRNWFVPFQQDLEEAIRVPLSNREVQYELKLPDGSTFQSFPMQMNLEDHLGREQSLETVLEHHTRRTGEVATYLNVVCAPFFVVAIPHRVLKAVGDFDERFGIGGAEDYDYCLRAQLANFRVQFVQSSYLLHFGNKSMEVRAAGERSAREEKFLTEFKDKWGDKLFDLCFYDANDIKERVGAPQYDFQREGFKRLIEALMENDKKPPVYMTNS